MSNFCYTRIPGERGGEMRWKTVSVNWKYQKTIFMSGFPSCPHSQVSLLPLTFTAITGQSKPTCYSWIKNPMLLFSDAPAVIFLGIMKVVWIQVGERGYSVLLAPQEDILPATWWVVFSFCIKIPDVCVFWQKTLFFFSPVKKMSNTFFFWKLQLDVHYTNKETLKMLIH